jgi:hypothetical protein
MIENTEKVDTCQLEIQKHGTHVEGSLGNWPPWSGQSSGVFGLKVALNSWTAIRLARPIPSEK